MKNQKVFKTILVVFSATISTLIMPIVGQWYSQKTGIEPYAFYMVSAFGGIGIVIASLFNIWDND
jgi:TRAP-type C4-dicarboxylate transport system permease small subunit